MVMTKKKTATMKVEILRMNRMGGPLASGSVVTFPGHTHMIGYQVRQPVHTFSHECNRLNLKDHEHYR
jgi:hypothetical protein